MASNGLEMSYDSPDLVKFYKAVKTVDVNVQKQLRKRLTTIAKPITEEVRQTALSLPSKTGAAEKASRGGTGVGLRAGIAAATETKVNPTNSKKGFSIRIRVSGTKFADRTGKYRKLPRYVEGLGKRKWRHPVFADKGSLNGSWAGAWVEQAPKPFLLPTVLKHKEEVREEVSKAFIDAMIETDLVK